MAFFTYSPLVTLGLTFPGSMAPNLRHTGFTCYSVIRGDITRSLPLSKTKAMISHSWISPVVRAILHDPRKKGGLLGFDGLHRIQGSKMSVLVERHGRPLACIIVPANVHDAMTYNPTLMRFRIQRPIGRTITRPKEILADAACDTLAIRTTNRRRGIKTMIPVNRRNRRRPKRGRSYRFDPMIYRSRGAVERFFSWVKAFRKISPRYERLEESFRGLVIIACILILWRLLG